MEKPPTFHDLITTGCSWFHMVNHHILYPAWQCPQPVILLISFDNEKNLTPRIELDLPMQFTGESTVSRLFTRFGEILKSGSVVGLGPFPSSWPWCWSVWPLCWSVWPQCWSSNCSTPTKSHKDKKNSVNLFFRYVVITWCFVECTNFLFL